ncbi:hypothetical protein LOD99_5804 [Oopsacas minuta]|uniref:Basic leucine zipper domain-containing protein n=1 Tax=Oopsacas minuta TaxID=111878 RepID=A0AAV7JR95_9METZ|nr:hypothetical protein LOD99_5804 [Oopsacas minuta]
MPKRISIDTYGLSEEEIMSQTHTEFLQTGRDRRLSREQIKKLKSYRRLLKVRNYGKDFRKRERDSITRLRQDKLIWERKTILLKEEIEWYQNQISIMETIEILEQFYPY